MGGYIATLDDGADRLKGVSNAFAYLGEATKITRNPKEWEGGRRCRFHWCAGVFSRVDKLCASARDTGSDLMTTGTGCGLPVTAQNGNFYGC